MLLVARASAPMARETWASSVLSHHGGGAHAGFSSRLAWDDL